MVRFDFLHWNQLQEADIVSGRCWIPTHTSDSCTARGGRGWEHRAAAAAAAEHLGWGECRELREAAEQLDRLLILNML